MKTYKEGKFIKYLNEQYPSQPKGSWLYQIQEKVLEELKMNSPGTQFIPATGGIPKDCDYSFKYSLDFEYNRDLKQNDFNMPSFLRENGSCGLSTYILGKVIRTRNIDIFHTIERNIAAHGDIGERIKKFEESHRVPPRGPEMKVTQDREYVSPLEEERKLKIKIDVTNCKGEPVFDKHHGQLVILPGKTERGELECPHAFPEECLTTENLLDLIIVRPVGALAIYTLKKGVNAEEDPIKIVTCGIDRRDKKETKVQIHGLELKVKPEKKEIFPGDKTKITVQLSEVDVKGIKQPVAGKHVKVQVKGLVDGHIYPSGDVITDQNGKTILTYDAGDKDKKVVVKAKFQPKDYPESVKDETVISIVHHGANAFLKMTVTNKVTSDDGTETLIAITKVMLKYNHTESFADEGMYIEHYDVMSWNVSSAMATIEVKNKSYKTQKVEKDKQENEELLIYCDSKTRKATEVVLPNTGFKFIFNDLNGMQMVGPGFYDLEQNVKGGDGIHEMMGGESGIVGGLTYTGKWKIQK